MELLMQDWSFSAKLRLPAISRLQKIHNVDVALQILKSKRVDLKDDGGNFCQHKPKFCFFIVTVQHFNHSRFTFCKEVIDVK